MATKKISLNELRTLVKQIIKEENENKRISFKPSTWNKFIKIVHIDGEPLNGVYRDGFGESSIIIYFDYNNQSALKEISNIIQSEFNVISTKTGESTKEQFWVEWKIS